MEVSMEIVRTSFLLLCCWLAMTFRVFADSFRLQHDSGFLSYATLKVNKYYNTHLNVKQA